MASTSLEGSFFLASYIRWHAAQAGSFLKVTFVDPPFGGGAGGAIGVSEGGASADAVNAGDAEAPAAVAEPAAEVVADGDGAAGGGAPPARQASMPSASVRHAARARARLGGRAGDRFIRSGAKAQAVPAWQEAKAC